MGEGYYLRPAFCVTDYGASPGVCNGANRRARTGQDEKRGGCGGTAHTPTTAPHAACWR